MTAAAPRYTAYLSKTSPTGVTSRAGYGYTWSVTDESTGLVMRSGWCAGPRRDAAAEARLAILVLGDNALSRYEGES